MLCRTHLRRSGANSCFPSMPVIKDEITNPRRKVLAEVPPSQEMWTTSRAELLTVKPRSCADSEPRAMMVAFEEFL